ncbi:MAG: hypothetical protein KTR20_12625 [Cellvibrionaceae bacterium]|nr:hypothetical protein [Cellvibrionaceae bacterium]
MLENNPSKKLSDELHTLVNEELALVQNDVVRVKAIMVESMKLLENSFFAIQHKTNEQRTLVDSYFNDPLAPAVSPVSPDVEVNMVASDIDLQKILSLKHEAIHQHLNKAMRALQSDDIVGQLSDRIASHVGDIRQAVDILSGIYDAGPAGVNHSIALIEKELTVLKERLTRDSARHIVAQENLDEGEIDLF